jgi:high-affinity iron transporter
MRSMTFSRFWFIVLLVFSPTLVQAAPGQNLQIAAQSMLHILDYVAVDYPHTVRDGIIVDPEEYAEQREFAQQLLTQISYLPDRGNQAVLRQQIEALATAIDHQATGEHVQSLCAVLSSTLIATYQVQIAPLHIPPLDQAASLFRDNCAKCHGAEGFGNGPVAAALRPQPSNFHDRERQRQRSVYGLYSTITLGVKGTAMPAFTQLREDERWALAFYVSDFFASSDERTLGKTLWQQGKYRALFPDLGKLTQATPAATAAQYGKKGMSVLAYLRSAPEQVSLARPDPLALTQVKLSQSLTAYRAGDVNRAYELAVTAYLEGFELAEVGLRAVDPALTQMIESEMSHYRRATTTAFKTGWRATGFDHPDIKRRFCECVCYPPARRLGGGPDTGGYRGISQQGSTP